MDKKFEVDMILTAITGSIGCGKTTISNILRKNGFLVYDIDKWVKYLYYKKDFLEVIKEKFPEAFEKGEFNKKSLRKIVFDNPKKLKILESLIHPFLTQKLRKIIRTSKNKGLVFVDIALIFEKNWDKFFDFIILADVDKDTQRKRVMKRDNITAEDFDKIDCLQMSMEEKKEKVDFIINTDKTLNKLQADILSVLRILNGYE